MLGGTETMSRAQKQYDRLDALEADFLAALRDALAVASSGGNDLMFCVRPYNPFRELRDRTSAKTEALLADADAILALRRQLGETIDTCPAERLHWYCRKWGDTADAHRSSAQGLAQQFVAELEANASAA